MQEHLIPCSESPTLSDWLDRLQTLHPNAIDLGLARVYHVAMAMGLLLSPSEISCDYSGSLHLPGVNVITVAGTNGKGSCCKIIEQCLLASGLTVGSYTSPHVFHYCERITINGTAVSESLVCQAFAEIDRARGSITLTYFEYSTLAALWLFQQQQVDIVILEVGMGGRLDATNIVDAEIAVITSIDLDHQQWLGDDRAAIAKEKAGICRWGRPGVCADDNPPETLLMLDKDHHCYWIGKEFSSCQQSNKHWLWQSSTENRDYLLPEPQLPLPSVAAGMQVVSLLNALPAIEQLMTMVTQTTLPGRYQQLLIKSRHCIFDVAHNPAATQLLAERLKQITIYGKIRAVFAVMADKDVPGMLSPLWDCIDHWYIGELTDNPRAASVASVANLLVENHQRLTETKDIASALIKALTDADKDDRIVIFGSFYTVEAALSFVHRNSTDPNNPGLDLWITA